MLTVLENVGPFPVALYRGEKEPGIFNRKEPLPTDTATQVVNKYQSQYSLRQMVKIYHAQNVVIGDQYVQFIVQMGDFSPPPDLIQLRDDYLAYLERTHHALDFKGIPPLRSLPNYLPLEEVYVPLLARPELPEGETWERRLAGRTWAAEALPEGVINVLEHTGAAVPVQIEEALREKKRVVVLGDPGSGKSTLLKHLALRLAKDPEAPLPILLPLNAFAKALGQRAINLQSYLSEYFKERAQGVAALAPLFEDALAKGKAVVLLDGLDEVQSERAALVEKVEAFAKEAILGGNRVLVTSRIVGYREAPLTPNDWALYTLLDFTPAEIEAFAEKWCLAFERSTLGEGAETEIAAETERLALLEAIEANPGVARLAANPLLLTILALIKRQGVELPKSRIKLYDRYLETLIEAWNKASALDKSAGRLSLEYEATLEVLGPLALRIREDNPTAGLVSERQLQDWLSEHYTGEQWGMKAGPAREKAREFLESVRRYSNLLVERGEGQYGFIHLTFEEALAAYGLVAVGQIEREKSLELIQAHLTDPAWRETILLSVGVLGLLQRQPLAAGELVRAMLKMDCTEGDSCQNVLLAGACLEDVGEAGLGRAAANDVVTALQEAALNRELPPGTQRDAGFVLGRLAGSSAEMLERIRPDLDEFIPIPAGEFLYGEPPRPERVDQVYQIAKYPVTNLQFKRFVDAKGYEQEKNWSAEGWDWRTGKWDSKAPDYLKDWLKQRSPDRRNKPFSWNNRKWNNPLAPVVGVSWFEAEAYCRWLSVQLEGQQVRLPNEFEWERAARGVQGREYAWGNTFERRQLNCAEFWAEKEDISDYEKWKDWLGSPSYQNASTTLAGQFSEGATPEGICDLSGNVWEWTDSWWEEEKVNRVVRGGGWLDDRDYARCASRVGAGPVIFLSRLGFRVVCFPI
jgi:formylglycine-generating enzyme required for sulfatase activity/energy-coupling factor transporter ATP-binding protein EcfA2